jgi:uncharacterized membrane protein YkgB
MEKIAVQSNLSRFIAILQISIGIVYLWFGFLKFFPNVSPAEGLASDTIHGLTFGLLTKQTSLLLLAIWEVGAGVLLVTRKYFSVVFWVVIVHMICTFTPLFLLPDASFTSVPYGLTLVGQYIIKNIIIVSALLVIREFSKKN